jgi:hypothetical protein
MQFQYDVGSLETMKYPPESFDAMALIYAHFPADKKSQFHEILNGWLKPKNGSIVILEAFSKAHLEYCQRDPATAGGSHFPRMWICHIRLMRFHQGLASMIRFVGQKK